jgi:nucleoid-associated protein YgaU
MAPEKVAVLIITGLIAILLSVTVLESDDQSSKSARLAESSDQNSESSTEGARELTYDELRIGGGRTPQVPRPKAKSLRSEEEGSDGTDADFLVHPLAQGETAGLLARRYYGTESLYRHILKANPEITNPARIPQGFPLKIPTKWMKKEKKQAAKTPDSDHAKGNEAGPSQSKDGERYHEVKNGESLCSIAKHYYGKESANEKIYAANRGTLKNRDRLRLGQRLVIP